MTGHGQAAIESNQLSVSAELRTVNNRFLKVVTNSDLPADIQANAEELIRKRIGRGTVNARIRLAHPHGTGVFRINAEVIESYRRQISEMRWPHEAVSHDALLGLPGAIDESGDIFDTEEAWPIVAQALDAALEHLDLMRRAEGQAMAKNLNDNLDQLVICVQRIDELAPQIVENFSTRLTDRINSLLEKFDVQVQRSDVVREIGIFAERTDMAEEVVRLKSHFVLFRATLEGRESNGRKLDFVVQEMLRETNTIGSKCSDAAVAGLVVEMKTIIERMREMVQNIE